MSYPFLGDFRITKLYGTPPPPGMTYSAGKHPGIDLVSSGDKIVRVVLGGTVYASGYDYDGWGKYTVIRQSDGLYAIYAHMSKAYRSAGQAVKTGDMLGIEGSTGKSTGSHLHFELRKNYSDKYSTIDPAPYLGLKNKVGKAEVEDVQTVNVKVRLPDGTKKTYVGVVVNNQNKVGIREVVEDLGFVVGWKNGEVTIDKKK